MADQYARGGQRVREQESRRGEEHQRDQEEPAVLAPVGGPAHHGPDHHVHRGHHRDEPEVGAVVLPEQVRFGSGQQQPEPGDRQGEVDGPDHDPRHR
jgi:hypothetical protein